MATTNPARERRRHRLRLAAAAAALTTFAWIAGGFPSFTWQATTSVAIPGLAMAAMATRWTPPRIPPPQRLDPLGVTWWLIIVFAFCEWEVTAFADGSTPWHPTLSVIMDPVLDDRRIKSAAFLAWLLSGWGLLRR